LLATKGSVASEQTLGGVLFARDVHVLFALVTALAVVAATAEGLVRAVRPRLAGSAARRTRDGAVLAAGTSAASGLALVVTGHRPTEWLHLVYSVLALGLIPIADNAAVAVQSPRGKALVRVAGGLVSLVVLARLSQTG
jgi:hypothetical protein